VSSADPLVVVPDARFGGGGQAMIDAFVAGARSLDLAPVTISPGFAPGVDGIHQHLAAHRVARAAREAASVWVVAAAAPFGAGAAAAGRPYACWVATSLADEWPWRAPSLPPLRRVAHELNAPLLRRLERRVLVGAHTLLGISPASRDALGRASGRTDVGILPVPVELARFAPEPDERWLARLDEPTVMFVGRGDDPRKNVGLLLDAWPHLRREIPGARLVLVGRPPACALPDGVERRGVVADVSAELRTATVLALPSHQEGFGIVAAEALACGVPVVTTPSGGPEELVRESHAGVILDDFDPVALGSAIAGLLQRRDRLTEMSTRGRAYVEREHAPSTFRERIRTIVESLPRA
jgi:glycosyltransferase involved in cell wall biosynthesis